VFPKKVLDTSHEFEWNYKGSVIKSSDDTFANYSEYAFTTSQAMRYDAYFHPSPKRSEVTAGGLPAEEPTRKSARTHLAGGM
jgi:hypothetical protein